MATEVYFGIHSFEGPPVGTYPQEITYTLAGGPGQTPTAAYIVFAAGALALDTRNNDGRISVGFTDGTNHRVVAPIAEDGAAAASADMGGRVDTGSVIQISNASSAAFLNEATFVSFGTDSITLDWLTNANGFGYIVFIYCPAAAVGDSDSAGVEDATTSVTGLGFQPDAVFAVCANQDFVANFQHPELMLSIGGAGRLPSVTQVCSIQAAEHIQDPTEARISSRDDSFASTILIAAGTASEGTRLEMASFDAGGYTYTQRNSATAVEHMYLALDLGDRVVKCLAPEIAVNATGTEAYTGLGFEPMFLAFWATITTDAVLNTIGGATTCALSIGARDSITNACVSTNVRDNLTTSDAQCTASQTSALFTILSTAATDYAASVDSLDADGFTLDVTDAAGAARTIPFMAVENRPAILADETEQISDAVVLILMHTLVLDETVEIDDDDILFQQEIILSETEQISDDVVLVSGAGADLILVVSETVQISDRQQLVGSGVMVLDETVQIADATIQPLGNVIVVSGETVEISDVVVVGEFVPMKAGARGTTLQGGAEAGATLGAYAERGTSRG